MLTLESGNVDQIVAAQRLALLPFILIAIAVTLASSFLLTRMIAAAGAAAGRRRGPGRPPSARARSRCPTSPRATTSWAT